MDARLKAKLDRMNAGLAPEDETLEQAINTGRLRGDDTYAERWIEHKAATGGYNPNPCVDHPQYAADNCPCCGTAAVIR